MKHHPCNSHMIRRISALVLLLSLSLTCFISAAADTMPQEVSVDPIVFQNPDFIRGMDVSSVLSLEQSGVSYRTADGEEQDLLRILAENGVNYIRVRVWNDPFDSAGNGYGGGNNDVNTAAEIGRRAAKYGMKLLVDLHYSDFWADPGKQKAPKAWSGMSLDEKQNAVREFTADALKTISDAGAQIGMVQIGNETTNGIAGEYSWQNMAKIFNAGSAAVREFSPDVKVAVHFTNPERTDTIKALADFLHDYQVDYDVFATSYYPYWHGSLNNLKDVLGYAAEAYGKYVMVAETSYAYTLSDSDGHPNTVSEYSNNSGNDLLWDFSPQGQADEVRAVMKAVNSVEGGLGLGVFYWEGAWITVGDTTGLSGDAFSAQLERNKEKWERDGSGWASSYSADFDPDDAGRWYGGSAVDNQAFFAPDGTALPSLRVFADVIDGGFLLGDADGDHTVDIPDVTVIRRICARMDVGLDETAIRRGDIDGDGILDIPDATLIQRYLARIQTSYPIGLWTSP